MENWEGSQLNQAKEILAFEVTKMVHGEEEAQKALDTARALFTANADAANMPSTELSAEDLADGHIGLLDLLVKTGLCPSKGEARRLVQQGGIMLDDEKMTDPAFSVPKAAFEKGHVIIKKGKKVYHKAILK